jgi:hypothetical protein
MDGIDLEIAMEKGRPKAGPSGSPEGLRYKSIRQP